MKLLVVLQNAYGVEDGYIPSYERKSFCDCFTGKRLREVIPDGVELKIINSSPKIGKNSKSYFQPDSEYVISEIDRFAPNAILFCGVNGKKLMDVIPFEKSLHMPHPAYRRLSKKITSEIKNKIREYAQRFPEVKK